MYISKCMLYRIVCQLFTGHYTYSGVQTTSFHGSGRLLNNVVVCRDYVYNIRETVLEITMNVKMFNQSQDIISKSI